MIRYRESAKAGIRLGVGERLRCQLHRKGAVCMGRHPCSFLGYRLRLPSSQGTDETGLQNIGNARIARMGGRVNTLSAMHAGYGAGARPI
jgi:hypothetical protein